MTPRIKGEIKTLNLRIFAFLIIQLSIKPINGFITAHENGRSKNDLTYSDIEIDINALFTYF